MTFGSCLHQSPFCFLAASAIKGLPGTLAGAIGADDCLLGTGGAIVVAVFDPTGFSAGTRMTRNPMCMVAVALAVR